MYKFRFSYHECKCKAWLTGQCMRSPKALSWIEFIYGHDKFRKGWIGSCIPNLLKKNSWINTEKGTEYLNGLPIQGSVGWYLIHQRALNRHLLREGNCLSDEELGSGGGGQRIKNPQKATFSFSLLLTKDFCAPFYVSYCKYVSFKSF